MEMIYSCCITLIIIAILLNDILDRKMQKQISELIHENEMLFKETIKQKQIELEIRKILALAENTHEFATHTVQKIKKLID